MAIKQASDATVHPGDPLGNIPFGHSLSDEQIAADGRRIAEAYIGAELSSDHLPPAEALAARWMCPLEAAQQWRALMVEAVDHADPLPVPRVTLLIRWDLQGLIAARGGAQKLPPSDVLAARWRVPTSTAQALRDAALRGEG